MLSENELLEDYIDTIGLDKVYKGDLGNQRGIAY